MKAPTFRDFVVLYIAEGYKRSRHTASICNSDPAIVAMAITWMRQLCPKPAIVRVQYHLDQDPAELRNFWGERLGVEPSAVRVELKSNSGQLRARSCAAFTGLPRSTSTTLTSEPALAPGWTESRKAGVRLTDARGVAKSGIAHGLGP